MTIVRGRLELAPGTALVEEAVSMRRRLHRRPELSGQEHATSELIRTALRQLGVQEVACPTPTGAVGLLDTGRPGKRVLIRADIDAVPVTEASGVDFESELAGRMHGCGHDGHTAILLAAAKLLGGRSDLGGSFALCFQPAEETLSGGRAMVAGGLLEALRPAAVIGLHLSSLMPSGTVVVREGIELAWAAGFEVQLHGEGGHNVTGGGGLVERLVELCGAIPGIAEGLDAEGAPAVASVGKVITDGAWNISPSLATVTGTHRTFSADHHAQLNRRLTQLVRRVGGDLTLTATAPAVVNDSATVAALHEVCRDLGVPLTSLQTPLSFADDVAEFTNLVPGCYFLLGARPPELETGPPHHSAQFRIDEGAFGTAIAVLATLAARLAAAKD